MIFWDAIAEVNSMLREEGVFEKFKRSVINANVTRCLYNVNILKRSSGYNVLKVKKLFCDTGIDMKIMKELELYNHEDSYFFVPEYPELLQFLEKTYEEYINDFADKAAEQEAQLQKAKFEIKELKENVNTLKKHITGRIDIKNYGNQSNSVLVISNSDDNVRIQRPDWFKSNLGSGIVIVSTKGVMETTIRCIENGELIIWLRGIDFRDDNNIRVPIWINYSCLLINARLYLKKLNLYGMTNRLYIS